MNPATPRAPAERLAGIFDLLCRAVAARGANRLGAPRLLAVPLTLLIWARLRRLAARFARLAARLEAAGPPCAPHRAAASRPRSPRPAATRPPPLPRDFGWLVRLVGHEAAGGASQLRHLLTEPDMAALIAASPRQTGRLLRPLCRMLGIVPPPLIAKPSPRAPAEPPGPATPQPSGASPPPRAPRPRRKPPAPEVARPACVPPVLAWVFG